MKLKFSGLACAVLMGCQSPAWPQNPPSEASINTTASVSPLSDPFNKDGWILNEQLSDEFDDDKIDESKWFVQGQNGDYYIWKGRAPAQFAAHNVFIDNGALKIRSQWEPEFEFSNERRANFETGTAFGVYEDQPFPVTTGAIVGKKRFLHGYMETRSRAAHAAMTSAFWFIGYQQELDVFEQIGRPKTAGNIAGTNTKLTVHDWRPPVERPTRVFGHTQELDFAVSEEFHTYGVEWGEGYLKYFIDGQEVWEIDRAVLGNDWVLTNPMEVWFDSEIFHWLGMPDPSELPAEFEIDYIRIWQQPSENLLREHQAFFGFEGPAINPESPRPLIGGPSKGPQGNGYQKNWQIDDYGSSRIAITDRRWGSGKQSMKYTSQSGERRDVTVRSPAGLIELSPGKYVLTVNILLYDKPIDHIRFKVGAGTAELVSVDLKTLPRDQWITLKLPFNLQREFTLHDQLEILIAADDMSPGASDFFLDDIRIIEGD